MPKTSLLSFSLLAVVLLAGCFGGASTPGGPTADQPTVESPPECNGDEAVPYFEPPDRPLPERADGFELTVNGSFVERGDVLRFTLQNAADERRYTGTSAKYLIQRRADEQWDTVTVLREPHLGFNATAIVHYPGEGFEWTFPASAEGFSQRKYVVCDRLQPGEYRFVYAADSPVAVRFTVEGR